MTNTAEALDLCIDVAQRLYFLCPFFAAAGCMIGFVISGLIHRYQRKARP